MLWSRGTAGPNIPIITNTYTHNTRANSGTHMAPCCATASLEGLSPRYIVTCWCSKVLIHPTTRPVLNYLQLHYFPGPPPPHTDTCTHARTCSRARTHTHTHLLYLFSFSVSLLLGIRLYVFFLIKWNYSACCFSLVGHLMWSVKMYIN